MAKALGRLRTLAIDIGGSGIKALVLDEHGKPITPRRRLPTPRPATPSRVIATIEKLAKRLGSFERVAVGFPGVVHRGVTESAPNLDPAFAGFRLERELSKRLGPPVRAANDADVHGFAVITGRGVELVITLGTGVGSALFVGGRLVPNLELAHHPFHRGKTYEQRLGKTALKKLGKKKWHVQLDRAIRMWAQTFNYDGLYLGGGNARKVTLALPANVKIVSNKAGLLGGMALWGK